MVLTTCFFDENLGCDFKILEALQTLPQTNSENPEISCVNQQGNITFFLQKSDDSGVRHAVAAQRSGRSLQLQCLSGTDAEFLVCRQEV